MEQLVVDTDVVSFIFKGDSRGVGYADYLVNKELIISFMTLSEVKWWALCRNWGESRQIQLHKYLNERYLVYFSDEDLCSVWAEVYEYSRRNGRTMSPSDAWIAATALTIGAPLVPITTKTTSTSPT